MITAGQVAVPNGSAVSLGVVPGGCQAALFVPSSGTIYVGNSTAVTTSTGSPLTGYALLPASPAAAAPSPLYAITAAGTVAVGVIISTPR